MLCCLRILGWKMWYTNAQVCLTDMVTILLFTICFSASWLCIVKLCLTTEGVILVMKQMRCSSSASSLGLVGSNYSCFTPKWTRLPDRGIMVHPSPTDSMKMTYWHASLQQFPYSYRRLRKSYIYFWEIHSKIHFLSLPSDLAVTIHLLWGGYRVVDSHGPQHWPDWKPLKSMLRHSLFRDIARHLFTLHRAVPALSCLTNSNLHGEI